MKINKLFREYPYLFFILAVIVISNDILKYAPGQVLQAPVSYIVPAFLIAFGIIGYIWKAVEKKKNN